jgi:hypothetical protein
LIWFSPLSGSAVDGPDTQDRPPDGAVGGKEDANLSRRALIWQATPRPMARADEEDWPAWLI